MGRQLAPVSFWGGDRGIGVFVYGGGAAGAEASLGVSQDYASNMDTFRGWTRSVCGGYAIGAVCAGANDSGNAGSIGLSLAPQQLEGLPSLSVKQTKTYALTTQDLVDAALKLFR